MLRAFVRRFGGPESIELHDEPAPAPRSSRVRVRVTHASLGSTDALARRGGYLLQPRPGFTPGYDLVGMVERSDEDAARRGIRIGDRVAACLPRMGAHRELLEAPGRLLVRVPGALPSPLAAALPLDLVTAAAAVELARPRPGGVVLVQGASGPVGALIVQLLIANGHPVLGTASLSNRNAVERLGAHWLDYRVDDPAGAVRALEPRGVAAAVDHTGSAWLRRAVAHDGTVVRLTFVGRPGRERGDTLRGGLATVARTAAHPRERLVSVPLLVASRPGRARAMLADGLERIATGELRGPEAEPMPLADAAAAHARLDAGLGPGRKLVLAS